MAASGAALGGLGFLPFGKNIQSFLHPEEGYKSAEEQMQKFFEQAQGFNQPFINNGQNQYDRLNNQANELNDPAALEAKWASGYTESPYAKQLTDEATSSGKNAASSMGLVGSSAALNNIQHSAGNIMQSDRQSYLNDLMQKYMTSIGIGENLYGVGANAANANSQNAMKQGENMAGLKYGEVNSPGDVFGKVLGTAANLGVNYATGGLK